MTSGVHVVEMFSVVHDVWCSCCVCFLWLKFGVHAVEVCFL